MLENYMVINEFKKHISARIKSLRKAKGITQQKLASILNVEQSTVQRWESARSLPTDINMDAIAKAFGISQDEIINFSLLPNQSDTNEVTDDMIDTHVRAYVNLSDQLKAKKLNIDDDAALGIIIKHIANITEEQRSAEEGYVESQQQLKDASKEIRQLKTQISDLKSKIKALEDQPLNQLPSNLIEALVGANQNTIEAICDIFEIPYEEDEEVS